MRRTFLALRPTTDKKEKSITILMKLLNKKMTPTQQMISQLMKQKHTKTDAIRILSEIERNQVFNYLYRYKQKPETVGSYFKKHQKKCLRKFVKE